MKKKMLILALIAVASPAFAVNDAQLKSIKKSLNSVPLVELPAKAAEIVKATPAADRAAVAQAVVQAAAYKSAASAPLVVSAISKAAPEVAATSSRAAVSVTSGQAGYITSAAINAAPQAKRDIVTSVSSAPSITSSPAKPSISASQGGDDGNGNNGHQVDRGHGVEQRQTPINGEHGGEGHGRFPDHPPFGETPPGHDPNHAGRPDFVDYTRPRHF